MFGYYLNSAHPLSVLERLHEEMSRAVPAHAPGHPSVITLKEEPDRYVLSADLPGTADKDLELTATHDSLTVRAKRELARPEGYKIHRQERGSLEFSRTVQLPTTIQVDAITADFKDGALTVVLPKSPASQPRTIAVRSA
jgi:HSP20 family protein